MTASAGDVWADAGSNYSDALKKASTGLDGKQYFIPFYYYPWAVFYRKSVFEKNGYQIPTTWDQTCMIPVAHVTGDDFTPSARRPAEETIIWR